MSSTIEITIEGGHTHTASKNASKKSQNIKGRTILEQMSLILGFLVVVESPGMTFSQAKKL
jgi:hypothetical protein